VSKTCYWQVHGEGVRPSTGSTERISLSLQTHSKDESVAESEFRRQAEQIGFENVVVERTKLIREESN
jgi:hypothetical protein